MPPARNRGCGPGALTMDRRTTFALLLCMLVFALFTALQTKYMPKPDTKAAATEIGRAHV